MAEFAFFHHHLPPAHVAVLITQHVRHLELHAVKRLLGLLKLSVEALVEAVQHVAPVGLAALNLVEFGLHMVCKLHVHNVRKVLFHQPCHYLAQRRRAQVLALFYHIVVGGDGGYGRRVRRRAAYPFLLQRADERGLGVARGRLGELLVRAHLLKKYLLPLAQAWQGIFNLAALLVLLLLVHRDVAGELELGVVCAESVFRACRLHRNAVIHRVCHLTGCEAPPDKPVEPVLLLRQILAQKLRREIYVGRAYRLVRVLRAALGFEAAGLSRAVICAIAGGNKTARGSQRLVGKAQGVGAHVGYKAHAALPGYLHALIKLLGNGHGAARCHAEAARGLLLQGGGYKGRRGCFLLLAALDGVYYKRRALCRLYYRVYLLLGVEFALLPVLAVIARGESGAALAAV